MIREISLVTTGLFLSTLLALAACTAASPTSTPTPTPTGTGYPVTVTDMLGRSVEVGQRPARIVTISPTATEILYQIGGTAIGRDTSSKYPPEAQDLPTVGGAYSPSVEAVAALQPDLVLVEALTQARFLDILGEIGASIITVRATSLDDVVQSLTLVGKVIDRSESAVQAIAEIRAKVEAATDLTSGARDILVLISDADRNIYAAKPESYSGAVAALFQLNNLASGLPDSGPFPGYTLYSAEQALTSNPDVIFTISPAPPPAPGLSQMLPRVPGYGDLDAVKSGRVRELNPELFMMAPGPRMADAAEEMARLLKETSE